MSEYREWLPLQQKASDLFGSVIEKVSDWHAATPDSKWDAGALARHVIEEQQWVPPLLAGAKVDEAVIAPLGDNLVADWLLTSRAANTAWQNPPAVVHLSFGDSDPLVYLQQQTFDLAVHAWDLGRSQGIDVVIPDDVARAVYDAMHDELVSGKHEALFADPVEAPDQASASDRLIALSGRDPHWK